MKFASLIALTASSVISAKDPMSYHKQQMQAYDIIKESMLQPFKKYSMLFTDSEGNSDLQTFWSKVNDFRSLVAPTEEQKKQKRMRFQSFSAEGRPEQIARYRKTFEENQELDEIKKSGTIVLDQDISNKLFERHAKQAKANHNQQFRAEPRQIFDFEEPVSLKVDVNATLRRQLQSEKADPTKNSSLNQSEYNTLANSSVTPIVRYAKNMNPDVMPDIKLYTIEEDYPVKGGKYDCQNDGVLIPISQTYYSCYLNSDNGTEYRVTQETYNNLTTLPYFQTRTTCKIEKNVKNNACWCPSGFKGAYCQIANYNKCYVNITQPALYKGCQGKYPDSDFYLYSIKGFDPCNFFNFDETTTIKFKLDCRPVDEFSVVLKDGHKEGIGYEYKDVTSTTSDPIRKINYVSTNNLTNMKVVDTQQMIMTFDFRDWKYMTNLIRFQTNITDPDVITGNKEHELEIDFKKMVDSDRELSTKFEVAGRMFFEAHVFSNFSTSYTTNGFFDREGYIEPTISTTDSEFWEIFIPVAAIGILFTFCIVYQCCIKRQKAKLDQQMLQDYRQKQEQRSARKARESAQRATEERKQ